MNVMTISLIKPFASLCIYFNIELLFKPFLIMNVIFKKKLLYIVMKVLSQTLSPFVMNKQFIFSSCLICAKQRQKDKIHLIHLEVNAL